MDNIYYILGLVVAFWLGKTYAKMKFLHNLSEHPERTIETLRKIKEINDREQAKEDIGAPAESIIVMPEEQQGVIYLFNKENDQFLGQGKTVEDALKHASDRFPNKTFWILKRELDTQTSCNT